MNDHEKTNRPKVNAELRANFLERQYSAALEEIQRLKSDRPQGEWIDDCISRQQAIDAMIEWYGCKPNDIEAFEEIIKAIPSVDRPLGEWILTSDEQYEYCTCSNCGYENGENWAIGGEIPFCAMCGAKMKGKGDE